MTESSTRRSPTYGTWADHGPDRPDLDALLFDELVKALEATPGGLVLSEGQTVEDVAGELMALAKAHGRSIRTGEPVIDQEHDEALALTREELLRKLGEGTPVEPFDADALIALIRRHQYNVDLTVGSHVGGALVQISNPSPKMSFKAPTLMAALAYAARAAEAGPVTCGDIQPMPEPGSGDAWAKFELLRAAVQSLQPSRSCPIDELEVISFWALRAAVEDQAGHNAQVKRELIDRIDQLRIERGQS